VQHTLGSVVVCEVRAKAATQHERQESGGFSEAEECRPFVQVATLHTRGNAIDFRPRQKKMVGKIPMQPVQHPLVSGSRVRDLAVVVIRRYTRTASQTTAGRRL
jgi:hypothetical protein